MDGYDAVAAVGIGLVGVGLWMIYPPVAFIAVGVLVILSAALGARTAGRRGR